MTPVRESDPVLIHSRREAIIIACVWAAATAYCCIYSYLFGYIREGRPLGKADVHPIFGMPSWFFWGVILPWGVCGVFTLWFVGFVMAEDDLGKDHSEELDDQIRGGVDD